MKAVVSHGKVHPLEPLPVDWQEGQQLRIEKLDESETTIDEIDRDFAVLASMCQESDPADEEQQGRNSLRHNHLRPS